jgi:hypothetical protein
MEIVQLRCETQRSRKPAFLVIGWPPCGSCLQTGSHCQSCTVNDWRHVECDAVRSGKDLPASRRIVVLSYRVKQLSLNCFTLKVKAVRCFETSVARSNVPDDSISSCCPSHDSRSEISPRCPLSCHSTSDRPQYNRSWVSSLPLRKSQDSVLN